MRFPISLVLCFATALGCGGGSGGVAAVLASVTNFLASATVGVPYSQTLAATGGSSPYTWAIVIGGLPAGLSLDAVTGEIRGTPTTPGTSNFTAEVTDAAAATATRALSITVVAAGGGGGSFAWVQILAQGTVPGGRSSHDAVTDPVNGRMIVALGSTGGQTVYGDSFALALGIGSESWSALPGGPPARWGHTTVYDSARARLLLFGGNVNGFQTDNDVWQLTTTPGTEAWSQLAPGGSAAPVLIAHGAIYDAANDRMVVFGGGSGIFPTPNASNEVWVLDFSGGPAGTWSRLVPSGSAPPARVAMVCVYDAGDSRMIVFGGDTLAGALNDVWALDLSPGGESWTQLPAGGGAPAARRYSAGAYDPVRDSMVIFGGENGASMGDAWELSLGLGSESWTQLAPTGAGPAARDSHTAAYDGANRRMIIYGGFTLFPSAPFTDIWELTLP